MAQGENHPRYDEFLATLDETVSYSRPALVEMFEVWLYQEEGPSADSEDALRDSIIESDRKLP